MAKAEKPLVGVITGSGNDWEVMVNAARVLDEFHVPWEPGIKSVHRTPDRARTYALSAYERGIKLILAGAGGSAHLPGVVQAWEPRVQVIGVPIVSTKPESLKRPNALASIIDMPEPVAVLTVDENDAVNAAMAAVRILSISHPKYRRAIAEYNAAGAAKVEEEDEFLNANGLDAFLRRRREEEMRREFG